VTQIGRMPWTARIALRRIAEAHTVSESELRDGRHASATLAREALIVWVRDTVRVKHRPPSFAEIGAWLGLTRGAAARAYRRNRARRDVQP
jgi:hypothetical protein